MINFQVSHDVIKNSKTKELSIALHVGGEGCRVSLKIDFFCGGGMKGIYIVLPNLL